jgi:hypothetical protein
LTFDTIDDVIKDMTRLREIAFTTGIFNLLTKDLTPMQRAVYKIMFETYHDLGGWGPYLPILQYEEVVLRALFTTHPRGKALEKETDEDTFGGPCKEEYYAALDELIEREGTEVKDAIDGLCAKDFARCHTIRIDDNKPVKVLIMRDSDRRLLMHYIDREHMLQLMADEDSLNSLR